MPKPGRRMGRLGRSPAKLRAESEEEEEAEAPLPARAASPVALSGPALAVARQKREEQHCRHLGGQQFLQPVQHHRVALPRPPHDRSAPPPRQPQRDHMSGD